MSQRFLLCRPQGGLNDMLCQIEKCCQYSEATARTVIVDTAYVNSDYFRDKFSRYFSSKQKRLILALGDQVADLDAMQVYPENLQGRLNSYEIQFDKKILAFCDTVKGQPITFDFNLDHAQPLLVHHQAGGGDLSRLALLRLSLDRSLVDALIARMRTMGGPWIGVHVRNTDYSTDYEALLQELKQASAKRIFLATDSLQVRERFQSELKNTTVYSFSRRLSPDGKPLHKMGGMDDADVLASNCDAILDLLTLALSARLIFQKVAPNAYGTSHSGYAMLAHNLWKSKILLRHLISDHRIEFGLG
jgi:hypothetical protein